MDVKPNNHQFVLWYTYISEFISSIDLTNKWFDALKQKPPGPPGAQVIQVCLVDARSLDPTLSIRGVCLRTLNLLLVSSMFDIDSDMYVYHKTN